MSILIDKHDISLIDKDYYYYLDTSDREVKKGFYAKQYDPIDDDHFEKKFPGLVKNRNNTVDRFLTPISKTDLDKISILSERLNYKFPTGEKEVKIIYESDYLTIVDYTEKSIAVFTKPGISDKNRCKILDIFEDFASKRSNLTGLDGKKALGNIFAKKSVKYDEFVSKLKNVIQKDDTKTDSNGTKDLDPENGLRKMFIWGTKEYVLSQVEDLLDEFTIDEEITLSDDRKKVTLIEKS